MSPVRTDDEPAQAPIATKTLPSAENGVTKLSPAEPKLAVGTTVLEGDATAEMSEKILAIIKEILLTKIPGAHDKWDQGRVTFLRVISRYVERGETVQMCLPAFPWKSANKVEKVLGNLPDKAEELALRRLNSICERIGEIYKPGAELLIISDGLVYNGKPTGWPSVVGG